MDSSVLQDWPVNLQFVTLINGTDFVRGKFNKIFMKKLKKWLLSLFKKTPKPTPSKTPQPPKPTPPVPTTGCQFPIQITTKKCSEVAQLQGKLMSMGGCIADILNTAGGADGKYGNKTAKLANIAYVVLNLVQS
jgi:hypothetical protein